MNRLKHYLFTGYDDPSIQWCKANSLVLIFGILLFVGLFSVIGGKL